MNPTSFCVAIFTTLVQQLGPEVVAMILDVLDGKGGDVLDEVHQVALRVVTDLQLTVTTDMLRAQLVAMEQAVDAVVNAAEEVKLKSEGQT